MAKQNKKTREMLEKSRKGFIRKSVLTIGILGIGAIVLCAFLGLMQNYTAERNQQKTSMKILDEVTETMNTNDATVKSIKHEFNELNQTTLETLSKYIATKTDYFFDDNASDVELSERFQTLAEDIGSDNVYMVDQNGKIRICSNYELVDKNLNEKFSDDEVERLISYSLDTQTSKPTVNGTVSYGESVSYNPIIVDYNDKTYYTYSLYFGEHIEDGVLNKYFLLTSADSELLDHELASIKDISSILDGISVGKSGFLFSVDTNSKKFTYFDNGDKNLTGESYTQYGFTEDATTNKYVGYQLIDNVKYFCTTQTFSSDTFGEFTVIAAVVVRDELVGKILTTVGISCFAFVMVSAIVVGYGMIIKHDIADHTIDLEKRFTSELEEESESNSKFKFTDEEIQERVKIKLEEHIEKNEDRQLSRKNIGTRNAKGVQRYASRYMLKKIAPLMIVGAAIIFGVSFFSQTLLSYQEAISVSTVSIKDVQQTIKKNGDTTDSIRQYISEQYLSKTKLISYLVEEAPGEIFKYTPGDKNTHVLFEKDENGIKNDLEDKYGNKRYSLANSENLAKICELNSLQSIYVYDSEGYVIATNTDQWFNKVTSNKEDRFYCLNDILDEKTNSAIEDVDLGSDENTEQFIAATTYYYTYEDSEGNTVFTNKEHYEENLITNDLDITKNRGIVQINISTADFRTLFEVTQLSYILNNMHVLGEDSFFVALDTSDEHRCVYSPIASSIGKTAKELNLDEKCFKLSGTYNGFTSVNGVTYYQSFMLVDGYYFGTAIPTSSIYSTRNSIASYTLLFSSLFIIIASAFYTVSSDKADKQYIDYLKVKENKEDRKNNGFVIRTANGARKTNSASSRYSKILWKNKTVEQKLASILLGYLLAASLFIVLILLNVVMKNDPDSIFTYIFSGEWDTGFNIFSITAALMVIVLVIAATNLVRVIVKSFCGALGARVETLGNLFVSIIKYGGMIGGLFYCLYLFGFDTTSLLTSAGILTIVVGLGAQSLISDIIAGMFIVFEGEFRVGDIVTIGDFRGQVIEIGLRTTKLLDISNNIKIFNNSSISGVLNMTKESSLAFITVGIEYGESLERVEAVLQKGFPKIKKKLSAIVDGPFYKGVMALNTSSVDIGIVATCAEQDRVQLARDLNREIFLLFNKNNINIPFPQVTVSYLKDEKPTKVTAAMSREAEEFAKREKEMSKDIKINVE